MKGKGCEVSSLSSLCNDLSAGSEVCLRLHCLQLLHLSPPLPLTTHSPSHSACPGRWGMGWWKFISSLFLSLSARPYVSPPSRASSGLRWLLVQPCLQTPTLGPTLSELGQAVHVGFAASTSFLGLFLLEIISVSQLLLELLHLLLHRRVPLFKSLNLIHSSTRHEYLLLRGSQWRTDLLLDALKKDFVVTRHCLCTGPRFLFCSPACRWWRVNLNNRWTQYINYFSHKSRILRVPPWSHPWIRPCLVLGSGHIHF